MLIKDKSQMYDMLFLGLFGNHMRCWHNLNDVLASPYDGEVSLRIKHSGSGSTNSHAVYHIPVNKLFGAVTQSPVLSQYSRKGLITYWEAPPDNKRIIQGELAYVPGGLYFRFTFQPLPMRLAFRRDEQNGLAQYMHATGIRARSFLRRYVDGNHIEHLEDLLTKYNGAVIEFSTFSVPVGIYQQTMVIWEVRHY